MNRFAVVAIIGSLLTFSAAWASESEAPITLIRIENKKQIRNLSIKQETVALNFETFDGASRPIATFVAQYIRKSWHLLLGRDELFFDKTGKIIIKVALTGAITELKFSSVGPFGEVEKEIIVISYPKWVAPVSQIALPEPVAPKATSSETPSPERKYFFTPALGYTFISYTQSREQPFSGTGLTAKLSFRYIVLPSRWDLGANAFFTALPLSSNRAGVTARYLGLNLRAGYALPWLTQPWKLGIMVVRN